MRAGDLDRRIRVERATISRDALGGPAKAWALLGEVWAQVTPISDGERWRAAEVAASATIRFRIRWGLGVQATDQIVFDGRVYGISGVKEIGRREGQEITAAARAE